MVIISNDDPTFRWWRDFYPNGFILVTNSPPSITYLSLHRVGCRHVSGEPANGDNWTVHQAKVCAQDREEIETWALRTFGETATLNDCPTCMAI